MEGQGRKKELLEQCNQAFYPHIDTVLKRLPEDIRNKILSDPEIAIISFSEKECTGQYYYFKSSVRHLIILSEAYLNRPEFDIIHTIAHEIAHVIVQSKETFDVYEMKAEDLVVKWGFEKESQLVDYFRVIHESAGYKIGYEWAKKQGDLSDFEEFYYEWSEGSMSLDRYKELYYLADPFTILDEMGSTVSLDEISRMKEKGEKVSEDDGSLDKGVVIGILGFINDKKAKEKGFYSDIGQDEKFKLIEALKRTATEISKMHGCREYYYQTDIKMKESVKNASVEIDNLLEKLEKDKPSAKSMRTRERKDSEAGG